MNRIVQIVKLATYSPARCPPIENRNDQYDALTEVKEMFPQGTTNGSPKKIFEGTNDEIVKERSALKMKAVIEHLNPVQSNDDQNRCSEFGTAATS